jgi:hypothetical protein
MLGNNSAFPKWDGLSWNESLFGMGDRNQSREFRKVAEVTGFVALDDVGVAGVGEEGAGSTGPARGGFVKFAALYFAAAILGLGNGFGSGLVRFIYAYIMIEGSVRRCSFEYVVCFMFAGFHETNLS